MNRELAVLLRQKRNIRWKYKLSKQIFLRFQRLSREWGGLLVSSQCSGIKAQVELSTWRAKGRLMCCSWSAHLSRNRETGVRSFWWEKNEMSEFLRFAGRELFKLARWCSSVCRHLQWHKKNQSTLQNIAHSSRFHKRNQAHRILHNFLHCSWESNALSVKILVELCGPNSFKVAGVVCLEVAEPQSMFSWIQSWRKRHFCFLGNPNLFLIIISLQKEKFHRSYGKISLKNERLLAFTQLTSAFRTRRQIFTALVLRENDRLGQFNGLCQWGMLFPVLYKSLPNRCHFSEVWKYHCGYSVERVGLLLSKSFGFPWRPSGAACGWQNYASRVTTNRIWIDFCYNSRGTQQNLLNAGNY